MKVFVFFCMNKITWKNWNLKIHITDYEKRNLKIYVKNLHYDSGYDACDSNNSHICASYCLTEATKKGKIEENYIMMDRWIDGYFVQ